MLTVTVRDKGGLTATATVNMKVLVPVISIRAVTSEGSEGGATDTGTASFELSVSTSAWPVRRRLKDVDVGVAAIPQSALAVTDRSARTVSFTQFR